MKHALLISFFLVSIQYCFSQDTEFKAYHKLAKSDYSRGDLYLVRPDSVPNPNKCPGKCPPDKDYIRTQQYVKMDFCDHHKWHANFDKCVIKEKNKDTLKLDFWPVSRAGCTGSTFLNESNTSLDAEDTSYVFVIRHWQHTWRRHPVYHIRFSQIQMSAITIPLRYNLTTGKVESSFLNAAVSLSKIWGKSRLFKSKFLNQRNFYWGIGGFAGFGGITDDADKESVGTIGGINIVGSVYKASLLFTFGAQQGFTATTKKTQAFIGFGVGIDLFGTNLKEIKTGE